MYVRNTETPKNLSREWLMTLLPKVGDKRMERPTINENTNSRGSIYRNDAQPCTVVYVHPAHLWYTVQFEYGVRESYKVPKYVTEREWRAND